MTFDTKFMIFDTKLYTITSMNASGCFSKTFVSITCERSICRHNLDPKSGANCGFYSRQHHHCIDCMASFNSVYIFSGVETGPVVSTGERSSPLQQPNIFNLKSNIFSTKSKHHQDFCCKIHLFLLPSPSCRQPRHLRQYWYIILYQ